jgi:glutathione peroxidase
MKRTVAALVLVAGCAPASAPTPTPTPAPTSTVLVTPPAVPPVTPPTAVPPVDPRTAVEPVTPPTAVDAPKPPEELMTQEPNLYALPAKSLDGSDANLAQYRGKVALVVNVASECGFTPQYAGLEKLWREYKDKGVVVLGVPSNEFGGQEPGGADEIRSFCTKNYGVTFPLLEKVETKKGAGQSPAYQYLTSATGKEPNWNFCKYLVGKDGKVVKFWSSKTTPESAELRGAIDAALR